GSRRAVPRRARWGRRPQLSRARFTRPPRNLDQRGAVRLGGGVVEHAGPEREPAAGRRARDERLASRLYALHHGLVELVQAFILSTQRRRRVPKADDRERPVGEALEIGGFV